MRLPQARSILAFFVSLLFVRSASAGTIFLSGGSIDYPAVFLAAPVHFVGDRGFSFDGVAFPPSFGGGCGLGVTNCLPGQTMSLFAVAAGLDLPGEATLDGISYTDVGGINSPESMEFRITGETITPPFGASSTEILVEPVSFTGTFFHQSTFPLDTFDSLVGNATATVTLTRELGGEPFWNIRSLTYDINNATPEPSSLLLLASGLVGLVARRACRRRR